MERGNEYPQQAKEPEDQERVVDPQPAVHIGCHANACSYERVFECKVASSHNDITTRLTR